MKRTNNMTIPNPIFSLKNFRSFGEEGADFEIAPITILTGCNSAGKSSLVKALMLLSSQHEQGIKMGGGFEIIRHLPPSVLNINTEKLALGQFDKVLHNKATSKIITFSYKIWSDYLQEEVVVKRCFIQDYSDILNNGRLRNLLIEKIDGTQICEFSGHELADVKDNFGAIELNYSKFIRVIEFLTTQNSYSQIREIQDKNLKQVLKELKQRLNNAKEELKKYNIQVESYKNENLKKWIDKYCDSFNERKSDTFLLDEKRKEEKKKRSFMSLFVNEVTRPQFTKDIEYINSSSALINRIYSTEDENKINRALRVFHKRSVEYRNEHGWSCAPEPYIIEYKPGKFLNKWIKEFGIGDKIEIESASEGIGIFVYLYKDEEKRLLADEGYGITQLMTLLLQIDNNIKMFVQPEGYPSFDEEHPVYIYPTKVICIEEPEVHLHPKYQSLLAKMFVEAYQKYNIHFVIETHSEYLIRKLQVMVADKANALTSNDVSLNYVEKDENGVSHNRQIKIKEDGRLDGSFGEGFFDAAGSLSRQLFMLID